MSSAHIALGPLIRRRLTEPESDPFDVVDWGARSVQLQGKDGTVVFACEARAMSHGRGLG